MYKNSSWLWIIAAETDFLSLSQMPRDDSDILGAGDRQRSEEIVPCFSRYVVYQCICGPPLCILVAERYFY